MVHSRAGRRLGITREDVEKLYSLNEKDFENREFIIFKYAREYALAGGRDPETDISLQFKKHIEKRIRKSALKIIHMMLLANYFTNTFSSRSWKEENGVCCINAKPGNKKLNSGK